MLTRQLKDWKISDEEKITEVRHELALLEEVYAAPKNAGVKNLFVPNLVREIMQDRVKFLKNRKEADLLKRLLAAGMLLGFNENGYVHEPEKQTSWTDLANALPAKDSKPFFVWQPNESLLDFMDSSSDLEGDWMGRDLGIMHNSLDVVFIHDKKVFIGETLRDGGMQTHSLTFSSINCPIFDSVFNFHSVYTLSDGFKQRIEFYFKEGRIAAVQEWYLRTAPHVKQEEITPLEGIVSGFEKIQEEGVTPQHVLYYIEHSNLSQSHLKAIAELTDYLKTLPKRTVSELFPAQEIREVRKAQSVDAFVPAIKRRTPCYQFVRYEALTPSEFSCSKIPDRCVQSVVVLADNKYEAKFVRQPSYLSLETLERKNTDWDLGSFVWDLETEINKMHWFQKIRLERTNYTPCGGISNMFGFRFAPSQKDIARYITEILAKQFNDLSVTVHYKNVPKEAYENSGLPNERATLVDEVLV